MAFQQTTASDVKDLLSVINSFAQSQGWTEVFNDIVANGQLGIEKGNAHITLGEKPGENPIARTDEVNGGTVNDATLYMVANHSINPATQTYWGQPNSIITSQTDDDNVFNNDLAGSFSNVWLYSNATGSYIHVVVQSSANRYTSFSFGVLDKKGMSNPDVAYVSGMFYEWWPGVNPYAGTISAAWIYPTSVEHAIGFFGENDLTSSVRKNGVMLFIPDGVIDPVLGFTDGDFQTLSIDRIMQRGDDKDFAIVNGDGKMLDHFLAVDNSLTTGGIPMSGLGVRYIENNITTYVGDYPDVRLVNMTNINPAQEIKFGADTWQCFPLKRKGDRSETTFGVNPQPNTNSIEYGIAIKKVV